MEDHSFDELTKKLASPISRRGILKAFTATIFGGILAGFGGTTAFAKNGNDDDEGNGKQKHCSQLGERCNPGHPCCVGVCDNSGPGANGKCVCRGGTTTCGTTCCPSGLVCNGSGGCVCPTATGTPGQPPCGFDPTGAPVCCGACDVCTNGKCVSKCGACETCSNGTCASTCNACQKCANGKCMDSCPAGQTCSDSGTCLCSGTPNPPCPGTGACCQANETCDSTTASGCSCAPSQMCASGGGGFCCPAGTTCESTRGICLCMTTGQPPCGTDIHGNAICCAATQVCFEGKCVQNCAGALCSGGLCCPKNTNCNTNPGGVTTCVCSGGNEPCGYNSDGSAICCSFGQFCTNGVCTNACPGTECFGASGMPTGVCCPKPYGHCATDPTGETHCACNTNGELCGPPNSPFCCGPGQRCAAGGASCV